MSNKRVVYVESVREIDAAELFAARQHGGVIFFEPPCGPERTLDPPPHREIQWRAKTDADYMAEAWREVEEILK